MSLPLRPPPLQPGQRPLTPSSHERAAISGLYVHIPFCFHKCHYCDFYSIVDRAGHDADRQHRFTEALIGELRRWTPELASGPTTIFVGGGTPTLLRPELWAQLLDEMQRVARARDAVEFTVEANPETVTDELMAVLVEGGVNRLSMGAQSFQPRLLRTLQRWHEPASVGRAMSMARRAGIDNLNLDLIFAIPGQTLSELDADLDAALALEPTHLSCYSLIFEPETPLAMKRKLGRIAPSDEETERRMYERVMTRLDRAGFEHYEISNWAQRRNPARTDASPSSTPHTKHASPNEVGNDTRARPGTYHCLHNLLYWTNRNWIGIGPSAASHIDGRRWKNVPHLGRYVAGSPHPPVQDEEQLEADAHLGEQLMLGLRLREGVALEWLESALPPDNTRRQAIEQLIAQQLLERTASHLRLTERGLFLADGVVAQLL